MSRYAGGGHLGGSGTSLDKNSRLEQLFHDITEEDGEDGEEDGAGAAEPGALQHPDADKQQEAGAAEGGDGGGGGEDEAVFVPPDGGYGWFVVLGAFFSVFWCSGFIKSYGLIFAELLRTFPDASVGLAAWIPAVMTSFALLVAPLAGALCKRLVTLVLTFLFVSALKNQVQNSLENTVLSGVILFLATTFSRSEV